MDWRKLSHAMPAQAATANDTKEMHNLTTLPSNILDALIPGYSIVSQYAQQALGVDLSLFVTAGVILFAAIKGSRWLVEQLEAFCRYFFLSSVYIDDGDDLFDMMMSWLDNHGSSAFDRSVRAKTQRGSQWEDSHDNAAGEALDERGLFDYNKWAARTPPRYEPYYGRNMFWHEGSVFLFRRSRKPAQSTMTVSWGRDTQEDVLQIDCLGRSTRPVKELLRSVKSWSLERKRHTTTIRHPTPKERARYGGAWSKTSSRPSRPMDTVILDAGQKAMIVKDMNEYLHPASPKWYATRGIPYRRGYLFHGPPGTGKTSLSFALAGIFGLEIYAISLQEPTLTESDLMQLFNSLPKRCIVLLEDVDAAGLLRDGKSDPKADGKKKRKGKGGDKEKDGKSDSPKEKTKNGKKDDDFTLRDLAKELKAVTAPKGRGRGGDNNNEGGHPNRAPGTGISLSGLLNAIDGVATHEGRVLIMTTNHPEKLDSALVRPGRVDRRVQFELAKKEQIHELFIRMYSPGEEAVQIADAVNGKIGPTTNGFTANGNAHKAKESNGYVKPSIGTDKKASPISRAELEELAVGFTDSVPDDTFTPAEIQNHLMRYKNEPQTAVTKVDEWKTDVVEEKEKQKKKDEGDEDDDEDDSENEDDDD